MKASLLLLFSCLTALLLVSCQEKETEKEEVKIEKKAGKVRIYISTPGSRSLPYYQWNEGDDKPTGNEPRLIEYILNQLNMDFEYISDYQYDGKGDPRIDAVATGKADLCIRGISINEERKKKVLFSEVYYTDGIGIVVDSDSELFGLEDLKGKKIFALKFSTAYTWIQENLKESTVVCRDDFSPDADPIQLLQSGEIDAYVLDHSAITQLQKTAKNTREFPETYSVEEYGIAVSRNKPELLEKINKVISDMRESGRLKDFVSEFEK